MFCYIHQPTEPYTTLYELCSQKWHISHRLWQKIKQANSIQVNGKPAVLWKPLEIGDKVEVTLPTEEPQENIVPTCMPLDILYEDDAFCIVNKPAGIPVHPSMAHYENSLSNGIQYYYQQQGIEKNIHIVNRLDKNTSGIVVFAKHGYVQEQCIQQMQRGIFQKTYTAICEGKITPLQGTITAPIARKEGSIIERTVDKQKGVKAITHYHVEKTGTYQGQDYSLVTCQLETGRTHQIRVHFSSIGHPLLGDDLYGGHNQIFPRQALHASKIQFQHPFTQETFTVKAPLPQDMQTFLKNSF